MKIFCVAVLCVYFSAIWFIDLIKWVTGKETNYRKNCIKMIFDTAMIFVFLKALEGVV